MSITEFPAPIALLADFRVFHARGADGQNLPTIAMMLENPDTGEHLALDVTMKADLALDLADQLSRRAGDDRPN